MSSSVLPNNLNLCFVICLPAVERGWTQEWTQTREYCADWIVPDG
jgi:hypothetical protein